MQFRLRRFFVGIAGGKVVFLFGEVCAVEVYKNSRLRDHKGTNFRDYRGDFYKNCDLPFCSEPFHEKS